MGNIRDPHTTVLRFLLLADRSDREPMARFQLWCALHDVEIITDGRVGFIYRGTQWTWNVHYDQLGFVVCEVPLDQSCRKHWFVKEVGMADDNNKIEKPGEKTFNLTGGKLTTKTTSFQDRINAAKANVKPPQPERKHHEGPEGEIHTIEVITDPDALRVPNRVVLVTDCSGSMSGDSNMNLRIAAEEFVKNCNFSDTSVAVSTFGLDDSVGFNGGEVDTPLSRHAPSLTALVKALPAVGGTPMHHALTRVVENYPVTRAVLVSDGDATDWNNRRSLYDPPQVTNIATDETIKKYREGGTPIDCVHIGGSTAGESLLRKIAEATGGMFIKFKDTSDFAKAFKFLAPTYRAMLGNGINLLDYGANEVKK